jgi:hypothetical protein
MRPLSKLTMIARQQGSTAAPRGRAIVKAIVLERYGSADRLELRVIDKPVPGDDDVLVEVHASGVDPGVWHLMTGALPGCVRWASASARSQVPGQAQRPARGREGRGHRPVRRETCQGLRADDVMLGPVVAGDAEPPDRSSTCSRPRAMDPDATRRWLGRRGIGSASRRALL